MSETASAPQARAELDAALAVARAGIDEVDSEIHALLIRRAELVTAVAAAKGLAATEDAPPAIFRPAREAAILRRLHARNKAPLPFAAAAAVWREMIGQFTAMQAPLTVSVQAPKDREDASALLALARNHFGAAARVVPREGFGRVAADVKARADVVGLVSAAFGEDREGAWWTACMSRDPSTPKVTAALPFHGGPVRAYCIALSDPAPSGDDHTLIAVQLDEPWSRSAIAAALKRWGAPATLAASTGATLLLDCEGFFAAPDEPSLLSLAEAFGLAPARLSLVGAYAAPLTEEISDDRG